MMLNSKRIITILCLSCFALGAISCTGGPTDEQLAELNEARVRVFFNAPGTRAENERDRKPDEFLVELIDQAKSDLDACVYGFSKQNVIDAVIRAHYRGVNVRIVGDARHFGYGERGYRAMQAHRIPMQVGNQFHIMHNKFFVVDKRLTFVGTGNITTTGFTKNNNNWIFMDHKGIADDFNAEFDQMFSGRFSTAKAPNFNGNTYSVGDTEVTLLFSPQEDTMGRVLEELDATDTSVHFQIFAFTKDQVGSRFIQKHRAFSQYNEDQNALNLSVLERPKKVVGILDKSQLHGNGQYHEGYRLVGEGLPMRIDANANSFLPGDYQAGGGRLHTKTMILDEGTENARVVTGSFNWSSAATIANDEVLLVLRGKRVTEDYMKIWRELYKESVGLPQGLCTSSFKREEYLCAATQDGEEPIKKGSVIISEVHWDGWNGDTDNADHTGTRDPVTNDEFIELYNTTNKPIDLTMWTLNNGYDVIMGFTPGTIIQPKQHFLLLDHNTVPYSDTAPIRGDAAFINPDFVLNLANDPRFPRLNLRNSSLRLELRAPQDTTLADGPRSSLLIDAVGDWSPPFAGGRIGDVTHSMERVFANGKYVEDGTVAGAWQICTVVGDNIGANYTGRIRATPGELNSTP